jgi:phage terminase large subunit-like protein
MPDGTPRHLIVAAAKAEIQRRKQLQKQKEEAEQDLLSFIRMFWNVVEPETKLIEGWPLDLMCDILMSVTDGFHKRLIINIFPGAMKSLTLNVFWPAWEWGPCGLSHMRYISAAYSASLTERDNGRLLRLVQSELYRRLWGDRFRIIKDGVGKVENSATGWKLATSVGGTTTGERGNRILIDDANNPATVESQAVRSTTNLWLREVMPDRLNDLENDVIINLQQRTHAEDATGTLAKYGKDYTWIMVPMEYDPLRDFPVVIRPEMVIDGEIEPAEVWHDPRGLDDDGLPLPGLYTDPRGELKIHPDSAMADAVGDLAWPARFSRESVEEQKTIKGPYGFAGQYNQIPVPRGGGQIRRDWWQLWNKPDFPDLGTVVASLDTAIKENEEADYNALTVWGAFPGEHGEPKLILIAAWRGRMPLAQLVTRVGETCQEKNVDYLLIEDKARGHDTAAEIVTQFGRAKWQTILIPANGRGAFSGDKRARLEAISPMFSGDVRKDPVSGMDIWTGGMIYEPGKVWSDEVVEEVVNFPRAPNDDYVDSVTIALSWMRRHGVVLRRVEFDLAEQEANTYKRRMPVPYAIQRGG